MTIHENVLEEKWLPIKDFERWYDISNYGRVRSYKSKDGKSREGKKPHILKNRNSKGDYLRIVLSDPDSGLCKSTNLHRLVYEHFVGEIPSGYQIHHIDGNKQNNRVDNLVALTPSEHRIETEKFHPDMYNGMNRYNKYEKPREIHMYDLDGNYLATFPNSIIAGKITGVCHRNILQVASKTMYSKGRYRTQAGGYYWSFEKVNE